MCRYHSSPTPRHLDGFQVAYSRRFFGATDSSSVRQALILKSETKKPRSQDRGFGIGWGYKTPIVLLTTILEIEGLAAA